jgi:hypothetical protein
MGRGYRNPRVYLRTDGDRRPDERAINVSCRSVLAYWKKSRIKPLKGARTLDPALKEMHQRFGQLEQRQRAVADARLSQFLGRSPERTLDAALND